MQRLTETSPVDPATGLAMIQFETNNPEGRLLDSAWPQITLTGKLQPVAWVPESAVVGRAGKTCGACGTKATPISRSKSRSDPVLMAGSRSSRAWRWAIKWWTQGAYLLLYRDLKQLMNSRTDPLGHARHSMARAPAVWACARRAPHPEGGFASLRQMPVDLFPNLKIT